MTSATDAMIENSDELIPTRQTLLSRLKDWQDQASWREFFDTYWRLLYGVALKAGLTEAEAQDVVQETMLAAARKMPGFTYDPAKDSFKGWLLTVTRWKIADQFRKRQKLPGRYGSDRGQPRASDEARTATIERIPDPAGLDLSLLWEREWQENLLRVALQKVKQQVNPAHYEMYHLHVIKQQPVRQVAKALRVNPARIYLAKYRISKLLRQEIARCENLLR